MRPVSPERRISAGLLFAGLCAGLAAVLAAAPLVAPASSAATPAVSTPELISRTPSGAIPDGYSTVGPLSNDGRFVTYRSTADDIVPGTGGDRYTRAYVVDRSTGTTHLLAADPDGTPWAGGSLPVALSPRGRFVYFDYSPGAFTSPDPYDPTLGQTYRYDTTSGAVSQVSDLTLTPSADGRYGVLVTEAALTPRDNNEVADVYRVSLQHGWIQLLSHGPDGHATGSAGEGLDAVAISGNGSRVIYSAYGDIVAGLQHPAYLDQVYLWNAATAQNTLVSGTFSGRAGNSSSYAPTLSADGRVVGFETGATNLAAGPFGGAVVRDTRYRASRPVVAPDDWFVPSESSPSLSTHGRYLAFTGFVGTDPYEHQVARYDRQTGLVTVVYAAPPLGYVDSGARISGDGTAVAWDSQPDLGTPTAVYLWQHG